MHEEPVGRTPQARRRAHAAAVREWAKRDERRRRTVLLIGLLALAASIGLVIASLL